MQYNSSSHTSFKAGIVKTVATKKGTLNFECIQPKHPTSPSLQSQTEAHERALSDYTDANCL